MTIAVSMPDPAVHYRTQTVVAVDGANASVAQFEVTRGVPMIRTTPRTDATLTKLISKIEILNDFIWNCDPMPNKKHEPWYVRMPQSTMDGLIDKSYERHGIL
ncbi:hypothetical protein TIFTF001_020413 [Ficus carica]|uniref:Uncharacterized protein n=1 Tax=Ficus carica TaxID=3494 RepID=A0AA88A8J3_FICCA|nr:hypothetical protein TIFTF001_020413 [Ficus carica]